MRLVEDVHPLLARVATPAQRPFGLSLIAAGLLAAAVGLAAVLFAQSASGMQRYVYREVAGAALGLGLTAFLAGATLSLPLARVARAAAVAGAFFCVSGVAAFVALYPFRWNVPGRDASPHAVLAYGIGLAYLAAALMNGLVRAYLEARDRREAKAPDEVTDEEVVRDLLETTARSRLTWGGVRDDGRELVLDPDSGSLRPLGGAVHRLGIKETIPAGSFGDDVGALLGFRGVREGASESYDDSPAQALARLRLEQAAVSPPWWRRLLGWWRSLLHPSS